MSRNYLILLITSIIFVFSSCVSKKKFLEMQDGRLKAEDIVRQLTDENNARAQRIEALIADFETMKNELMQSNAIKDQYIDSLNSEVFVLNENLSQQEESLQETSFTLDFEKQRLTTAIENKDKSIRTLESRIVQMETEIESKSSVIDQYSFDKRQLNEQVNMLDTEKRTVETKLEDLQAELQTIKAETATLKSEIEEKDSIITRLENNVKLLKKELGR